MKFRLHAICRNSVLIHISSSYNHEWWPVLKQLDCTVEAFLIARCQAFCKIFASFPFGIRFSRDLPDALFICGSIYGLEIRDDGPPPQWVGGVAAQGSAAGASTTTTTTTTFSLLLVRATSSIF